MNEFISLSRLGNNFINLQIIKNFGLLIPNLSNKQNLYYIFSNNFINQIITNFFKQPLKKKDVDEEDFFSFYINFIKSISIKLDETTVQFFFHAQANSFPLLDNTLLLFDYQDQMIKNVARSTFLTILKMKFQPIIDYICTLPQINYFILIAKSFNDNIAKLILKNRTTEQYDVIKDINDDIINDIIFFQDVLNVGVKKVNYILINTIFSISILPILCGNLIRNENTEISLFVLWQFLNYMKDETFLNCLVYVLYNNKAYHKINKVFQGQASGRRNIYLNNMFEIKTFEEYIKYNFSENFFRSLPFVKNTPFNELKNLLKKYYGSNKSNEGEEMLVDLMNEFNTMYTNQKTFYEDMEKYHTYISKKTGIHCGISFNGQKGSFLQVMKKVFSGKAKPEKMEENIIYKTLMRIFNEDAHNNSYSFVYNCLIFYQIQLGNKFISKEILHFINYGTFPNANYSVPKQEKETNDFVDINSLENLRIDSIEPINNFQFNKSITFANFLMFKKDFLSKHNLNEYYSADLDNKFFIGEEFLNRPHVKEGNNVNLLMFLFFSQLNTDRLYFNTITVKMLVKLFENIPKNQREQFHQIIKGCYINSIYQVKNLLNVAKNNYLGEIYRFCFEYFERELDFYKKDFSEFVSTLITNPCFINSTNLGRFIPSYMVLPRAENSIFKYLLEKFFSFYDLKQEFALEGEEKTELLKSSKIPLSFSDEKPIEENEVINLSSKKLDAYSTKMQEMGDGRVYNYSMFFSQNCVYFAEINPKDPSTHIVRRKFFLRRVEASISRTDSRRVLFFIMGEESYKQFEIICNEPNRAKEINMIIANMKANFVLLESIIVDSYFTEKMMQFQNQNSTKK